MYIGNATRERCTTYDASVVDEDVEPLVAEDGLKLLRDSAHTVKIADIELDDCQRALRGLLQRVEGRCLLGVSAGGDNEVVGILEKLRGELETNTTGCPMTARELYTKSE